MKFLGVIPARYGSSRFEGKPLELIHGKTMIEWVYKRTLLSNLDKVVVATDDERIEKVVKDFGGEVVMTSKNHETGTDRIAEVAEKYSDFDVRNYGYTKLSVLIDEEMDNFMLVQEDTNCYVEFKELTSRETIEEEVIHFVKKNGGSLDNLSAVTLELKDKHSGFNIKDYGYSRMSSFLRSIHCLAVNGNTVRLKRVLIT